MSDGFAGGDTKKMQKELTRELEQTFGKKRLDVFTEDFSPPGATEKIPGVSFDKSDNGYQDKHTDTVPRADRSFTLAAAGPDKDPSMQELDDIDQREQEQTGGIKPMDEQFPGKIDGPESFHKSVEKRMKHLSFAKYKGLEYETVRHELGWYAYVDGQKISNKIYSSASEAGNACRKYIDAGPQ